jgi:hypothetical protein
LLNAEAKRSPASTRSTKKAISIPQNCLLK